jgi:hypothetical protein
MADGIYERRGPREAELKRLQRLIDERRKHAAAESSENERKSSANH